MKTKPSTHYFIRGESDHAPVNPQILCARCEMPEHNSRHKVTPQSAERTAFEHRLIGERV